MTKEQLDAIRARVAKIYYNSGGFDGCFIDVTNLLAEVERLTGERDTHAADVERQMNYGVKQHEAAQDALRDRAAAFARGVEAMRSEAVSTLMGVDPSEEDSLPYALHIISNADPKDK